MEKIKLTMRYTDDMCRKYNAVIDLRKTDLSTTELITVAEVKPYLKIDFNDDDALITKQIPPARKAIEKYTGLSLVPCEIEAILRNEKGDIALPRGPYEEDTLELTDKEGKTLTDFKLEGLDFPLLKTPTCDYIRCFYEAGYNNDTLPADLRLAIIHQVCYLYENLGDSKLSESAKELAKPYKRKSWLI